MSETLITQSDKLDFELNPDSGNLQLPEDLPVILTTIPGTTINSTTTSAPSSTPTSRHFTSL